MMTVFSMEDGSFEVERVDILTAQEESLRPLALPALQLLSVAESESIKRPVVAFRH